MIEALGGTLAPIARSEKPQLSPWHATSFTKKERAISRLRLAIAVAAPHATATGSDFFAFFAGLLSGSDVPRSENKPAKINCR
jgi:hypothetical protein